MLQNGRDSTGYCQKSAEQDDPDRYLLSLFAPRACRPALWALIVLNQEIARTRELVTEATVGLMRLQWWRDEIGKIFDRHPARDSHPVLQELDHAIAAYHLPREPFDTLLYAREFDLEDVLPANLQGMENYADYTNTPLLVLMAKVLGVEIDPARLRYLGVAYGVAGLLRAVPFHAVQHRCYLPQDILELNAITAHRLYERQLLPKLPVVIGEVVAMARDHLVRATDLQAKPLRAAAQLTDMYLKQLERAGYDVFSPNLRIPPKFREWRLFWSTLF